MDNFLLASQLLICFTDGQVHAINHASHQVQPYAWHNSPDGFVLFEAVLPLASPICTRKNERPINKDSCGPEWREQCL
eukprot:scaffold73795_cov22-Prasinocladus_malaysianus.AAC.1